MEWAGPHYWLDRSGRLYRCWDPQPWVVLAARHARREGSNVPTYLLPDWFGAVQWWSPTDGWMTMIVKPEPGFGATARCISAWAARRALWKQGRRSPIALLVAE